MPNGECPVGAENRAGIKAAHDDRQQIWGTIAKLWERVDRLPAWATLMMTGLGIGFGTAVGALVTLLAR